ncbi:MAG TPA: condensation domain-containing protein, partial [Aquella sp.]|nr:condensation domain-containing protein [Aquella sp.]
MYKIRLSPYHEIFYNEWKLDPSSSKYNIVFDQIISSELDITCLKTALNKFISEYLLFNSHVLEIDGEPYWVKNSDKNQLELFNDSYTYSQIFKYVSQPFYLNSGPLYRFAVFKEGNGNYRLVFVLHHLIIDGNGFDTFISHISSYYNSTKDSSRVSLTKQLERNIATTETLNKQAGINNKKYADFWQSKLSESEVLDLRFLRPCAASAVTSSANLVKELRFSFNKTKTLQLEDVIHKYNITKYTYSQCIFAILLHR